MTPIYTFAPTASYFLLVFSKIIKTIEDVLFIKLLR